MRTIGVEEELLLVSTMDGRPMPVGDDLAAGTDDVEHEFKQEQAEIASAPTTAALDLRADLVQRRAELADAARSRGAVAVAIATSLVRTRPHQTHDERYERMNREFGLVARQQLTCGQHVHVGVDSRDEGVAVIDRIGRWLPAIAAISSNSPFWQGTDTGYASYRTVLWGQWPTAGPTGPFGTVAEYDRQCDELIASGAALDGGMIYFDARLSASYPTVEIRVADVCSDVDDAVLIATLCRALVEVAAEAWTQGAPVTDTAVPVLRAARWRAARSGLDGQLVDPQSGKLADAWMVVDALADHLAPALERASDLDWVQDQLRRLRSTGTGAQRQRARASLGLTAVVADAAQRTLRH